MRGLFLDLDGTLADSLEPLRQIYHRFLYEFGHLGNRDELDRLNGPNVTEIVSILKKAYDLPGPEPELVDLYNKMIDEIYTRVAPLPGSLPLLQSAKREGWAITIVTSNLGRRTRTWLQACAFEPYISHVVSGDQVSRGKPHPDLYLAAIHVSKCSPSDSFAIEDSSHGARAAIDAGLPTFVCLNQPPVGAVWPPEARFISSLEHFIPYLQK